MKKFIEMENYFPKLKKCYDTESSSDEPMAYIRVNICDNWQNYGTMRLVVPIKLISTSDKLIYCNARKKNYHENKFYNELVNQYFIPFLFPWDYHRYYITLMNYMLCQEYIQNHENLIEQQDCIIILNLNTLSKSYNTIRLYTRDNKEFETVDKLSNYNLINASLTGIHWTFLTRLNFLTSEQMSCLLKLVDLQINSGKKIIKLTADDLTNLMSEFTIKHMNKELYFISRILYNLEALKLITWDDKNEGNNDITTPYYSISVCEIELYYRIDQQIYNKLSA